MTKDEAKRLYTDGEPTTEIINRIYEDFESMTCEGCIHKPKIGENYSEECRTCSRFYADEWEKKID